MVLLKVAQLDDLGQTKLTWDMSNLSKTYCAHNTYRKENNVNVGLTDPILDLWDPPGEPQNGNVFFSTSGSLRALSNLINQGWIPKCIISVETTKMGGYLTFETKSGHFGSSEDLFRGQKIEKNTTFVVKGRPSTQKWMFF